jgi:hypothetical protein
VNEPKGDRLKRLYSVESKSSSFAFNIPDSVRSPASSCSIAGAAKANRMAFGACPGVTAKVIEGVKATSRGAAAATNVREPQCRTTSTEHLA